MKLLPSNIAILFLSIFLMVTGPIYAADIYGYKEIEKARADKYAPIGVSVAQTLKSGEFMLSYRFKHIEKEDNLAGSRRLSSNDILSENGNTDTHLFTPVSMTTEIQIFSFMYAPVDAYTLMLVVPYADISMKHQIGSLHPMNPEGTFTTEAKGIGDIQLNTILTLEESATESLLMHIGISLPTGSINQEDNILPLSGLGKTQLPFPMQIGSGTYDLLPTLTYNRVFNRRSWGSQISSVVRLGQNNNGYTLGNRAQLQTWLAWVINTDLSLSTRFNLEKWDNVDGDDRKRKIPKTIAIGSDEITTVPSINPQSQGGKRADIALGINGVYGKEEHRVGLELVIPVQQHLNGPQLEQDLTFIFAYQKAF